MPDHALSRRRLLSKVVWGGLLAGAALPLIGDGVAKAQKVPQKAAQYQDKPKDGHSCSGCNYFLPPHGCQLVDGTISPDGWCQFWLKKT